MARPAGGKKPWKLAGHDAVLRRWMEQENGLTIAELHAKCREELGIEVAPSTVWYRRKSLGLSYKKVDAQQSKSARTLKQRGKRGSRNKGNGIADAWSSLMRRD